MPLSPDEQRILEEIEQRLSEEDPRLAEQVSRTSLYTHLARRIRWSLLAFLVGLVMLMSFWASLWVAAIGFCVMLASSLFFYRYLKQLGRDQFRSMQQQTNGRFSIAGMLARLATRFRDRPPQPPQTPES
jgi:ABC-type bacteriocin/lantibiotic exporter with double-glycine peptidase domain